METAKSPKTQARELIDQLPDNASSEHVGYRLELHASIERGLADSEAGRVTPQEEVERRFGVRR
jgi:predicted transcriptional regulator